MVQNSFDIEYAGSLILADTRIEGELKSKKDVFLEGLVNGDIHCDGRVFIAQGAMVDGNVNCKELYIAGVITGDATVSFKAILKADSEIRGHLTTVRLEIMPGAKIRNGLKLINASKNKK